MTTQQHMRGRTMSMTTRTADPMRQNPITSMVAAIREMEDDLTPRQREIREYGRRRTAALVATGLYDPVYP